MESTSTSAVRGVGVGWRTAAVIIDSLILLVVFYMLAALAGQTTDSGFELEGGPMFISIIIYFGFYIVCEALWAATPGKLATGLRVVREDGNPIGWRESSVRNALRIVDGLFFYLVGAILIWTSAKHQRLGDRIAETLVVRRGGASAQKAAA